jgi:phage head maturation protease
MQVLQGFAVRYNVVHVHKNRRELFTPGCFSGSLDGILFGIDHRYQDKKLGNSDDGSLELADTRVGLAFRLKLAPGSVERIDGRDEVSPSYVERLVEVRSDGVRVIKSAILVEISSVFVGAMRTTHAVVCDASKIGTLLDDAKSNFENDGAAHKFMNALKRIQ